MIDIIFQQASFDEKKDIKRIEAIAKEVEQRAKRTPGYRYDKCIKCGRTKSGFTSMLEDGFVCIRCILKDEVKRRSKEDK